MREGPDADASNEGYLSRAPGDPGGSNGCASHQSGRSACSQTLWPAKLELVVDVDQVPHLAGLHRQTILPPAAGYHEKPGIGASAAHAPYLHSLRDAAVRPVGEAKGLSEQIYCCSGGRARENPAHRRGARPDRRSAAAAGASI